jgi:hypothetical protein
VRCARLYCSPLLSVRMAHATEFRLLKGEQAGT